MRALRAPIAFDGERFLPGGATVIVEGAVITGVEPAAYGLPDDCPVTVFAGTMLPGLFDTHVHLVSDSSVGSLERAGSLDAEAVDDTIVRSLRRQAASGVTTVRDLGDVGYRTLGFRDPPRPGLPRIRAAGPPLTVPDGHCHYLGGVVRGPDAIRAAVRDHEQHGVDLVKVMASGGMTTVGTDPFGVQFDAAELRKLVYAAHGVGLPVLAHAHSLAGMRHALAAGVDGIEHFTGLTETGIRVPDDLLDGVAEAGVAVDPTLGFDRGLLASMPAPPQALAASLKRVGLDLETAQAARLGVLRRARARGIRLVTGVDAGAAPAKPHGIVGLALAALTEGGFSIADAVTSATAAAARACDLAGVTGRLAPGLDADILLVDGNLEADVTALQRPVQVLIRGNPVTP
ncbi:amidohydrolase family protein [Nocardioides mesophilus]|uniref:Amidohydrolase family protein n=1 Tax=Nocardioides mesophilus TaxID=433659 RepID=A0A7G9RFU1_9ACTN|nr:amidohydrolase family protein [Nocardioides mesophilus]QNN54466.1 amidohydrolase family protein [Nocardioides mesophilus]